MTDYSHLNAIQDRIHRETMRFMKAHDERERQFRFSQVCQAEKELASEYAFLGIVPAEPFTGSDDDLLLALDFTPDET